MKKIGALMTGLSHMASTNNTRVPRVTSQDRKNSVVDTRTGLPDQNKIRTKSRAKNKAAKKARKKNRK